MKQKKSIFSNNIYQVILQKKFVIQVIKFQLKK